MKICILFIRAFEHLDMPPIYPACCLLLSHHFFFVVVVQLAKAEKLKPMEIELKKLEDLTEATVQEFARMKQREQEHKDTNESTNQRLLHFSVFSTICLVALAVLQVLYLKRYFKQKKLI